MNKNNEKVLYINDPYFVSMSRPSNHEDMKTIDSIISNKPKRTKINGYSLNSLVKAIYNNPYVIIYREGCGYSIRARNMLKNANVDYLEIDIGDIDATRDELNQRLSEENFGFPKSYRTVPMIFKNGKFIRGSDDLPKHL